MRFPTVSIIGPGRLGSALKSAFLKAGYDVNHVYERGDTFSGFADLILVTTPDSEVRKVSSKIASSGQELNGKVFIHCSGAFASSILQELKDRGARTACFHPLMSVSPETVSFKNIYFDIEGDESVLPLLEEMAKNIGAKSIRVSPKEKELLHVSAVMASNYMVTLADLSLRISVSANIPERTLMDAFLPLMRSSLENLERLNPTEALTGPIARGDIQTIQKHVKLLQNNPEMLEMYKKLGLLTLELISSDLKDSTIKFRLYDLLK
ncbi:MAG: DUF2520 domain-containing protein [Balneolaceae bacterium]|nr:DUF2520 domain-containing protein [Balneolaceae bacterium]MBO6547448.1 DUF2520 domain-containing protein [Balneolaceae bacterium]MBO6647605.1 DUF2520 domain-containing protein [Balneolaceae bacterium]